MSFTNFAESLTLNYILTTNSVTRPTEFHIGLFTAAPGEAGGGTEVTGGSYVRRPVTFAVSGTAPTLAQNPTAVEWPTATANWGVITHVAVFDASSGGNMIDYAMLDSSKEILNGDVFRIPVNSYKIEID